MPRRLNVVPAHAEPDQYEQPHWVLLRTDNAGKTWSQAGLHFDEDEAFAAFDAWGDTPGAQLVICQVFGCAYRNYPDEGAC